jgi:hypothetical protein
LLYSKANANAERSHHLSNTFGPDLFTFSTIGFEE